MIDLMAGDLGADLPGQNTPRTIELWAHYISQTSWAGEHTVIEMGRGGTANFVFGIDMVSHSGNNGVWDPYTNGFGNNDGATAPSPVANWNHLAWGYDGAGHFQFVVNGVKVTLPHPGDGTGTLKTAQGIFTLGGSGTSNFGYAGWEGVMDEVRVWSTFRPEADIRRDMLVKLKGTEPGLIAYWNLDEGTGEIADDIQKAPGHQLKFCTVSGGACPTTNVAKPKWVASDIPGTFTCAP